MTESAQLKEYGELVAGLKARIEAARLAAARSVTRELILLYWDIGGAILVTQERGGWGDEVTQRLSSELQQAFPGVSGFSARNLRSMRQFHQAYSTREFWLQVVAKLGKSGKINDTPETTAVKSSYHLEFLGIAHELRERDLEDRLIRKLQEFHIEAEQRTTVAPHGGMNGDSFDGKSIFGAMNGMMTTGDAGNAKIWGDFRVRALRSLRPLRFES
jgi:predicted nuclease of restriction endonuclease-like (RecB) superfamily